MPIPLRQNLKVGSYFLRKRLGGEKRYPFIVEIEPLFACNLSCPGCGKIQHPTDILRKRLSVEDVVNAVMFLASEESSYITGQVLPVTGGWF